MKPRKTNVTRNRHRNPDRNLHRKGCCGHDWETWGEAPDEDKWEDEYDEDQYVEKPPYEADGFEKETLRDLSRLQICRTDDISLPFHSRTVSFKRNLPQ
jgi:hypothetical protein